MLSAAEAAKYATGVRPDIKFVGGLLTASDGSAEPELAAPGFALGARKLGAKIYQFCAVRGIERSAGRVSAVITEKGRVEASTVIIAGGVWSPMLGHDLGLNIPIVQCFAKAMSLWPFAGPDYGTASIVGETVLGWRKQYDGGYIVWEFEGIAPIVPTAVSHYFDLRDIRSMQADALRPRFNFDTFKRWLPRSSPVPLDRPGPYEETRIYEPELMTESIDRGFTHVQQAMPVFEHASVRERWSGAMTVTIDNMPIISGVDTIPGLYLGTGLMWGLSQGPGAGMVLADLATGKTPAIDTKLFRYSRFTDGSKLSYYA